MMSVNIIVLTLCFAHPLQQDLMMSHSYGVDNYSLRFRRKGRHFDLVESRF